MKIKKAQIPLITVVVALIGTGIYGFISNDIKQNKLVKQCNDGKIESCDEVPELKYGLLTNEKWIKDNFHTKYRDFRINKEKKAYKKTKPTTEPKKINKTEPKKIKRIDLVRFCEKLIKENLKDPDSYKKITSRDRQEATGIIEYTATNSFGGRVRESFTCFDPSEVNKQVLP